jgi:hypothetical protein
MSYRDINLFCYFHSLVCSYNAVKKFEFPVSPAADETLQDSTANHVAIADNRSLNSQSHTVTSDIHESPSSVSASLTTDQSTASSSNSLTSFAENSPNFNV